MNEWIEELCDQTAAGEAVVLVTVAAVRGSAPREVGAKMIVTATETIGTIGGGQLEYQCTRIACGIFGDDEKPQIQQFPLGASMGQCCGGVVDILFEPIATGLPVWLRDLRALHGQREPAVLVSVSSESDGSKSVVTEDAVYAESLDNESTLRARELIAGHGKAFLEAGTLYEPIIGSDFHIAVFGAGHVGAAVAETLSRLDCNIRWVDSRRNIFRKLPGNVRAIEAPDPALEVAAMPAAACYLVMTHSHAIDLDVVARILQRGDALYCGLIGSRSKRRRFEKRLREQGLPEASFDFLTCPIGVDGITGKKPAEIAIAAAAEVLQAYEKKNAAGLDLPENVHPIKL